MFQYMLSRDGKKRGTITNLKAGKCRLEGCKGWRIRVVWADGKVTFPCECGCKMIDEKTLQII